MTNRSALRAAAAVVILVSQSGCIAQALKLMGAYPYTWSMKDAPEIRNPVVARAVDPTPVKIFRFSRYAGDQLCAIAAQPMETVLQRPETDLVYRLYAGTDDKAPADSTNFIESAPGRSLKYDCVETGAVTHAQQGHLVTRRTFHCETEYEFCFANASSLITPSTRWLTLAHRGGDPGAWEAHPEDSAFTWRLK